MSMAEADSWSSTKALWRLPTIEAQFVRWLELIDAGTVHNSIDLKRNGTSLYLRRSVRSLPCVDEAATTLDIASVCVSSTVQGRGWFTAFLAIADALNPWDATYVECVHNVRLAAFLPTAGFIELPPQNFFRPSHRWRARHEWSAQRQKAARAASLAHAPRSLTDTLNGLQLLPLK
ncbi:hypothetical protein [Lysobacter sp.]|uniref:hypothetical protein n=1 Tax=Lysobacter sp. TaxID=72226 RepID=UPI002D56C9DC|nr:hypothetical protein [Lysobacter sp.]HZX77309.1 hypothetical protein [Lysobacter sp.]